MNLSGLILDDNIYCQPGFDKIEFEREYISIRRKEGRLLDDDTVRRLPFIDQPEWKIRAASAKRLADRLQKENCRSFIEIGCGNGWLTNYLQERLKASAFGIDVNKTELGQAARISNGKAAFIYGDIFSLKDLNADAMIFAASVQYFPNFEKLIKSLSGVIHIIDSPFYHDARDARHRSEAYFASNDSNMTAFYFHHELKSLKKYNHEILYKPNRIKTLLGGSPFPWIRIRKGA